MDSNFLRRKVFEPFYYARNKSPFLSYWKKLEQTQYFSLQEIQDIQWRRLKKMYTFLWQNNVFYRDRFQQEGLTINSIRSLDDIAQLPVLTKKDIRENIDAMISDGYSKKNLLHFKTGGSTGKALDIFMTDECSHLRNACTRRFDRWTGWEPGEPIAAIWGNPELPKTIKERIKAFSVMSYIYLDTMSLDENAVLAFVSEWKRVQPTLLYGHAHSLFILARYLEQLGIKDIHPRGILSTSMMLLPHERTVIEEVFGCRVTDRYGCEEVSLIGCECEEHDGMHMNIEHLVIEFIKDDGSKAQPGEPGNIIVTDLMNYAMPFIRYKVEDVGVPLQKVCSCGRGLPLMGKVAGRVADFLVKKDGTKVAGISLIENTLTRLPGIDQMQIVQQDLNLIELNIVCGKEYSENIGKELLGYFSDIFPGAGVQLNQVAQIEPESSGKYRFSICKVSSNA